MIDKVTTAVTVTGPLTLGTNLKILDSQLQQMIEGGQKQIVLDLSGCPYMDSAGLGFLIHVFGLVNEKNGALRLCGVNERVAALLRMTHTDQLLSVDVDRATSLAALA